jgi:hypothetical protein
MRYSVIAAMKAKASQGDNRSLSRLPARRYPSRGRSLRIYYDNSNSVTWNRRAYAGGELYRLRRRTLQRRYQPVWLGGTSPSRGL